MLALKRDPFLQSHGKTDIERFRHWLQLGGDFDYRDKYLIDGNICLDYFIRYETLHEGISAVCQKLDIHFDPNQLPMLKAGLRPKDCSSLRDFYDVQAVEIVQTRYQFELDYFQYDLE